MGWLCWFAQGRAACSAWSSCCSPGWAGVLAEWLQYVWLPRNSAGAAQSPSGETKTEAPEPSASLLQLSLTGCEGSELFHADLCNGTRAFIPELPV